MHEEIVFDIHRIHCRIPVSFAALQLINSVRLLFLPLLTVSVCVAGASKKGRNSQISDLDGNQSAGEKGSWAANAEKVMKI